MERRTRLILTLAAAWALCAAAPAPQQVARHADLRFASGRQITVDVVDTPAGRETGLMYRKSLPRDYGMLFVFPIEIGNMTFWMKNTWVSLDIVFIGADHRITRIHERVPPSTAKTTDEEVARARGPAQYVLELPAGAARRYKLKVGQPLDFAVPVPER
ncbi:MAG: DUF192 domain-containing protein [Elusimicrobia bacterium]|nr:DUF192 domain-containing protein [Elusimicrobiota bacterium]